MNPKRICLYGGPGVGKSTIAAGVFHRLRSQYPQQRWALVTEWIKARVYKKLPTEGLDQVLITANQFHEEETPLRAGFSIVTDSPVSLGMIYDSRCTKVVRAACELLHEHYPNVIPIFLERDIKRTWETEGRFGTFEEALEYDEKIRRHVEVWYRYFYTAPADVDSVWDVVCTEPTINLDHI